MRQPNSKPGRPLLSYAMAFVGLAAVTGLFLTGRLSIFVAIGFWAMSAVSVIAYALDKSAAQRGDQRLSESSLHLISVLGGWPGALVAQQVLRHKSKKQEFRAVSWITVLLNISVVIWFLILQGRKYFGSL